MFEALRRDSARYREAGGWWANTGFWAVAAFRFSSWARALRIPGVRALLLSLSWCLKMPFRVFLHVELPSRATIGPGFALFHAYNVLIPPDTQIGEDCSIYHEVTLGADAQHRVPHLGNNVVLFAGSRVIGNITIGDRTEVGVNCVVTRSVPADSIVAAPAPRVIPISLVRPSSTRTRKDVK